MKRFNHTILFLCFLLCGCSQTGNRANSTTVNNPVLEISDKEQIANLVRQMYRWHDTDNFDYEMNPIKADKDSVYIGIDLNKHKTRLDKLQSSNFLSAEFVNNYDKIVRTIDTKLKNKELVWVVGELPPFGNDASPWCNCQDYPEDHSWDKINFNFISIDSVKSTLT